MPEFTADSRVRDVVDGLPEGSRLLFEHGYDVGEGLVDNLSQFQRLAEAERSGRLRDLHGLLEQLNRG